MQAIHKILKWCCCINETKKLHDEVALPPKLTTPKLKQIMSTNTLNKEISEFEID